jgi:transposase-like protein
MKHKAGPRGRSSEKVVKDIRRATRKRRSPEEKIRIVLEGLRGEKSIAELCRRESIVESLYYSWSKEFLEAGTHMEAHRHAGALHTAVGMSVDRNRTVNPGIHLDQWIQRPTIYIDDEICVEKGKLRVYYDDPEILEMLDKYNITLD